MSEELMHLIQVKRAWTEAAKCAEKEGSVVAANFCRTRAKEYSRKIKDLTKTIAQEGCAA